MLTVVYIDPKHHTKPGLRNWAHGNQFFRGKGEINKSIVEVTYGVLEEFWECDYSKG